MAQLEDEVEEVNNQENNIIWIQAKGNTRTKKYF